MVFSLPRFTVATASRRWPPSHTATFGSASALRIHCEFERTVLTVSVSPIRVDSTGTGRGRPERRPGGFEHDGAGADRERIPDAGSHHGTDDPVERGEAPLGDRVGDRTHSVNNPTDTPRYSDGHHGGCLRQRDLAVAAVPLQGSIAVRRRVSSSSSG